MTKKNSESPEEAAADFAEEVVVSVVEAEGFAVEAVSMVAGGVDTGGDSDDFAVLTTVMAIPTTLIPRTTIQTTPIRINVWLRPV